MKTSDCENTVNSALLNNDRIRTLHSAVQQQFDERRKSQNQVQSKHSVQNRDRVDNFKINCCDCSQMNGTVNSFARAVFSAPCKDNYSNPNSNDPSDEGGTEITLCTNRLEDEAEVQNALTHELVHAFDHCSSRYDLTNPLGLACSEIRAAREAECYNEFGGMMSKFICEYILNENPASSEPRTIFCRWRKQKCVESTASVATDAVFPGQGRECVAKMMDLCFRDCHPVDNGNSKKTE